MNTTRPSQFTSGVYELLPGEWHWTVGCGLAGTLGGWCDSKEEAERRAERLREWAETWPEDV